MNNEDDTFDLPCTVVSSGESRSTERGFRFREMLVQTRNRRFPQTVPIQFSGRRVDAGGMLKEGDEILITASLRGHAFNGRHYVQVEGWKIQRYDAAGNLYVVAPPDTSQPPLFPAAPPAPAPPPVEPWSATRTYRPGDRAILEGKVCVYRATPGGAQWTIDPGAAANATPAGTLNDVPF
jgi:hypothetical protein